MQYYNVFSISRDHKQHACKWVLVRAVTAMPRAGVGVITVTVHCVDDTELASTGAAWLLEVHLETLDATLVL